MAGHDFRLVAEPGKPSLVMTRSFAAPRPLVFEALTKPELVRQWLLGPPGWTMPVCEIDLRVGGRYRYEWRREGGGAAMGMPFTSRTGRSEDACVTDPMQLVRPRLHSSGASGAHPGRVGGGCRTPAPRKFPCEVALLLSAAVGMIGCGGCGGAEGTQGVGGSGVSSKISSASLAELARPTYSKARLPLAPAEQLRLSDHLAKGGSVGELRTRALNELTGKGVVLRLTTASGEKDSWVEPEVGSLFPEHVQALMLHEVAVGAEKVLGRPSLSPEDATKELGWVRSQLGVELAERCLERGGRPTDPTKALSLLVQLIRSGDDGLKWDPARGTFVLGKSDHALFARIVTD